MPLKGERTGEYIECEVCGKLTYKTQTNLKKYEHHYCSNECAHIARHNAAYENRPCEICGKIMHVSKKSTQRFCSDECQHVWQTQQVGLLNARCTRKKTQCEYCGDEFLIKNYKIQNNEKHFCCAECRRAWYAEVWSQSDEWKEKSRIRAANLLQQNKVTTMTKPQIAINELLNSLNIEYRNEETFKYYAVDNYLPEYNLIIEVMGDYWHANPLKYNQLSEIQRKNVGRDKAKHSFLFKYYNIEVLYLWERDIIRNIDLCEQLIKAYIANNGVLENYNSFNFSLVDNNLIINEDIIQPYQCMTNQELHDCIDIAS